VLLLLAACANSHSQTDVTIQINGSKKLQLIDGFGVNANSASWGETQLEPALDLLVDSLHATIWRLVVETEQNWEVSNDNHDPFSFNREYYNQLYETPKFQKIWNEISYLNSKGITDKLIISVMGGIPDWMGRNIIFPGMEDEVVEMHVSFLDYAIHTMCLKIGLYSPINETDLRNVQIEGPHSEPGQFARIEHKLLERMNDCGLNMIRLVSPDLANMQVGIDRYMPLILNDSLVMSGIKYFGFHSYGGYYAPLDSFIHHSGYPAIHFWMTEFNAWRDGLDHGETGVYNYDYASECVHYLMDLIRNGASACIVWEAYDSPYEHHGAMSYWGILGLDERSNTFTPRKHFYALAHVFRFVPPGSRQVEIVQGDNTLDVLAFSDSISGRITITGINGGNTKQHVVFSLENLPKLKKMDLYYTDSIKNLFHADEMKVSGQQFIATVPARCIFTISGIAKIPEN